jgi:hypothetical protein
MCRLVFGPRWAEVNYRRAPAMLPNQPNRPRLDGRDEVRGVGGRDDLSCQGREKRGEFKTRLRVQMRLGLFDERERMRPYRGTILAKPTVVEHSLNLK